MNTEVVSKNTSKLDKVELISANCPHTLVTKTRVTTKPAQL